MKYLKKFNESDNNEYYTEISSITSQNLFTTNQQKFSSSEYNILVDKIRDKFKKCGSLFNEYSIEITFGKTPNTIVNTSMYKIHIIKYPDEWYYITFRVNEHWSVNGRYLFGSLSRYFKCDQFEGLIICIENLIENLGE